jgi:hypothetical protein
VPAVRLWIGGVICLRSLFSKGGPGCVLDCVGRYKREWEQVGGGIFFIRLLAICIYGAVSLR